MNLDKDLNQPSRPNVRASNPFGRTQFSKYELMKNRNNLQVLVSETLPLTYTGSRVTLST